MNASTPAPVANAALQLPAHLQQYLTNRPDLGTDITNGLGSQGHAKIGIKQARWRIIENGVEEVLNTLALEVIIVGANRNKSKVFYLSKYNNKDDEAKKAPDCWSDNGVGPSARCSSPQAQTCAACPHNVWGSRITDAGNQTKACADYKKLAVVLADDLGRNAFELRVPPASLKPMNEIITRLMNNKIPLWAVVFELTFDPSEDYPKINFKPVRYIDQTQTDIVQEWLADTEINAIVGSDDTPRPEGTALPAAQPAPVPPTTQPTQPTQPAYHQAQAHQAQAMPMGIPVDTRPVTRRRGRPAKASDPVGAPPAPAQAQPDLPGPQAAAQVTPIQPATTDAHLDSILAGIL